MQLNEISDNITLRTGKMTQAQVIKLVQSATTSTLLMLLQTPLLSTTQGLMRRWVDMMVSGAIKPNKWPKPLTHIPSLESNPGIWIFDDRSGIKFVLYSDEHRKNAFKGTSVDVVLPQSLQVHTGSGDEVIALADRIITASVTRFFDKVEELSR